MPRHNPTSLSDDDGHGRHERRLEDDRARSRRRARRQEIAAPDGPGRQRAVPRQRYDQRDLERQVADWRAELMLVP